MITNRYEKGDKFLDLETYSVRYIDEDGTFITEECWECLIYPKKGVPSDGQFVEFASETLARMFVVQNEWKEQVL